MNTKTTSAPVIPPVFCTSTSKVALSCLTLSRLTELWQVLKENVE